MRKQTRHHYVWVTYKEHEQEIMSGTVETIYNRFILCRNLGRSKPTLSKQDQIPGEVFASHDRIGSLRLQGWRQLSWCQLVSRSHPEMIKNVWWSKEICSLAIGTVETMSVAREAGDHGAMPPVATTKRGRYRDTVGSVVSNIKKITSKFHPARYVMPRVIVRISSKKHVIE